MNTQMNHGNFDLHESIQILERTPSVLHGFLCGLNDKWIYANEGENTFSAFDVIGHLIHGEKTDWIVRMELILSENDNKTFSRYDRFAQLEESKGKDLEQLLQEFSDLRKQNLKILKQKKLSSADLLKTGNHPVLGIATLKQLLSTWVAHDLSHTAQICRVMAKHYKQDIGPWIEFLPIMSR